MRTLLALLLTVCLISSKAQNDEALLEKELYNLPDVSFTKTSKPSDKVLQYDLLIKQPLDHKHPEKDSFYQRVKLKHKGFNNPTVMLKKNE